MRTSRWVLGIMLVAVTLAATAWLIASVNELHDRLARHSAVLAFSFVGIGLLVATVSAILAARVFWKMGRADRPPPKAPEDVIHAAEIQADRAEEVIAQVRDEP